MSVAFDLQATGWSGDDALTGHQRVRQLGGDAVRMPFTTTTHHYTEASGPTGTGAGIQPAAFLGNPDGSGRAWVVSTKAKNDGTGLAYARTWIPFRGRFFGVAWHRGSATTAPEFDVIVDGEAVRVAPQNDFLSREGITNSQLVDVHASIITHPFLDPDIQHYAAILLTGHATLDYDLTLYGVLLDRKAGYAEVGRYGHLMTPGALTTSDAALTMFVAAAERAALAIRSVVYTNTTDAAIVVTVTNGSTLVWSKSVGAHDSEVFDPRVPIAVSNTTYKHKAATTGVNFQAVGVR